MHKVIFACVHNAGRSQMAAAFYNQLADRSKTEAISAGTEPGLRVHPEVLTAMQGGRDRPEPRRTSEAHRRTCRRSCTSHHNGLRRQVPLCARAAPR